jgi:ParB family transcriptional regulator, chromosome partitioning protein
MSNSTGKVVKTIRTIPIDQIRFLNPRVRNRRNFHEIVQRIAKVGLKPLTPFATTQWAQKAVYLMWSFSLTLSLSPPESQLFASN